MTAIQARAAAYKASQPATVKITPLGQKIARYFSTNELSIICFELNVAEDSLAGRTKLEKASSLAAHMAQKQPERLLAHLEQERPHVDWKEA
ncbi:MAG: hypothetical protein AAF614_07130 [Chloroflexota bacterium]